MSTPFSTSRSLLRALRFRLLAAVLMIVLLPFAYPWRGRTEAQRAAALGGYFEGLWARVADPVLWERALIGGVAFSIVAVVFAIGSYRFSVWAHSVGKKNR